jgi:acylphosphatase
MSTKHLMISGRVQGVGYRDWLMTLARALRISGWVRNRSDGRVEALLSGESDAVEELLRACRRGPRAAEVTAIEESFAEPPEDVGFAQRPTV